MTREASVERATQHEEADALDEGEPVVERSDGVVRRVRRWLTVDRAVLGMVLLPMVVAAVALVVRARTRYFPTADHALTELQVRDVGRHEVLIGLYSRADWNHPGPALFYLLAPIYRLSGSTAIGINLGALVINAAAIVGIALVARRRGGTPLLLCSLIGVMLLARTLGAGFLGDAWNNFIVVFPFALLILLAWSMSCGETWALWVGVAVASFLAQTHVGFVLLGFALLAWGVVTLVVPALRSTGDGDPARRREVLRATAIAVPLAGVLWLPPVLDVVLNAPSNARKIVDWFRDADEGTHTPAEGWRVTTGQFGPKPEWLTGKLPFQWGSAESPFMSSAPLPWLLLVLAAAGYLMWRRRRAGEPSGAEGWRLTMVVAFTLLVGIVAVARTVGPAFDYRLRWTWVAPMVAFVLVAWTVWLEVAGRWPWAERRVLQPIALASLAVLSVVQVATAAQAVTPREADSAVVEALLPDVLDALDPGEGQVLVNDPYHAAGYYTRALVLELERAGIDARVPAERGLLFGQRRVVDADEPIQARLVVAQDRGVAVIAGSPGMESVARWEWAGAEETRRVAQRQADVVADLEPGQATPEETLAQLSKLAGAIPPNEAKADEVVVFLDRS